MYCFDEPSVTARLLRMQALEQHCPVRGSEPRARVPAWSGRVRAVGSRHDVVETFPGRRVHERVQEADRLAEALVQQCDEPRPEWRNRARATDRDRLAV